MSKSTYSPLQYIGDTQKHNKNPVTRNGRPENIDNYIPDEDLVKAVNLAMLLEKPLLVMGEPGCGKSLLAKAIAYELYKKDMYNFYREWHIKSTSKAKEGLYEFDYVHRLRDANLNNKSIDIKNVDKYIHLGPMGEAFELSKAHNKRAVLLIDEIDKADIDFPNDLLNELDRMEFEIREKPGTTIKANFRPVVIITSNSEKDLPDAFLRRCIFHYIEPLSNTRLKEIVIGRYYDGEKATDPLIDKAIQAFVSLRETIKNEMLSIGKNVSTSEFINWFQALKYYSEQAKTKGDKEAQPLANLLKELDKLDAGQQIPFSNILLKNSNSVIRFNEKAKG